MPRSLSDEPGWQTQVAPCTHLAKHLSRERLYASYVLLIKKCNIMPDVWRCRRTFYKKSSSIGSRARTASFIFKSAMWLNMSKKLILTRKKITNVLNICHIWKYARKMLQSGNRVYFLIFISESPCCTRAQGISWNKLLLTNMRLLVALTTTNVLPLENIREYCPVGLLWQWYRCLFTFLD